eukprot:gene4621-4952_t
MSYQNESTLDLLESCLQNIYRIRTNSLMARSKEYKETFRRQQSEVNPLVQKVTEVTKGNPEEEEEAHLIQQLALKLPKPHIPSPPKASTIEKEKKKKPINDESNKASTDEYEKQAQAMYEEFVTEFQDIQAELQQFRASLAKRKKSGSEDENDDEEDEDADAEEEKIEQLCNYLIDKYLDKLDTFPASVEVSNIKRSISSMVEELASSQLSSLPPSSAASSKRASTASTKGESRVGSSEGGESMKEVKGILKTKKVSFNDDKVIAPTTEPPATKIGSKPIAPSSNALGMKANSSNESVKPSNDHKKKTAGESKAVSNTTKPNKDTEPVSKEEAERKKIREQYEKFMNLKKNVVNHEDNSKIEEYEKLNQEIQDVLSSVQNLKR